MSAPRNPYFVPPPAPPPPPKGPSPLAGLRTIAITLGVLLGVAFAAILALPALLERGRSHDDREESKKETKTAPLKVEHETKSQGPMPVLPSDPSRGGTRPLVTIVEFGDFQDPFTARVESTLEDLLKKYGSDLRIVWKDNPLSFHVHARKAAKIGRVAWLLGGETAFFKFHRRALTDQKDMASDLDTWASDVGANAKAMIKYGEDADKLVEVSMQLADEASVKASPVFFIDGERLTGARTLAEFEKIVDAHIKEAKSLLKSGVAQGDLYEKMVERHWESPEPGHAGALYAADATGAPTFGPSDAPVTIVLFDDFARPPSAADGLRMVDLVALANTRVVHRDIPSTPAARETAAVVRVIGARSKSEMAKAIDEVWTGGIPKDLSSFGVAHGLVPADVSAAIASAPTLKDFDLDRDAADEVDATTTTVYVNGRKLLSLRRTDVLAWQAWEKKHGERLIADGVPKSDVYDEIVKKGIRRPRKHVTVTIPAHAPVKGPASAKVIVHVFADLQCPFCKKALTPGGGFAAAVAAHAADVKVVYRHNPLPYHALAEPAAQLAIEAKAQKGNAAFFRVIEKIHAESHLDMPKLEAIALAEGLDLPKVKAAIASHAHKKVIDDDVAEARRIGAFGTPAFVVGDELISGAQPQAIFDAAIVRAKAKAP